MFYETVMSVVPEPHAGYADGFDDSSGCANMWLLQPNFLHCAVLICFRCEVIYDLNVLQ
jgi:hypothetical protein